MSLREGKFLGRPMESNYGSLVVYSENEANFD
jgi:hypothetical protein